MIQTTERFNPWSGRFLIRPKERPKETTGGLVIADTVTLQYEEGTVMGVGDEKDKELVGKVVIYPCKAGWPITVSGELMKVIQRELIEGDVG